MIELLRRIIIQTQKEKFARTTTSEFLRLVRKNQSQIVHLNTYKDQVIQIEKESNITTESLHLDDLLFNDPLIMTEWTDMNGQLTWEEILMDGGRMDSEGEAYYPYDRSPQNEEENED